LDDVAVDAEQTAEGGVVSGAEGRCQGEAAVAASSGDLEVEEEGGISLDGRSGLMEEAPLPSAR